MKKLQFVSFLLFVSFLSSCDNDDNVRIPSSLEVQDFIWKGLNLYYYWQEDSPDLSDNRFETQNQLNNFLTGYPQPESLFEYLLVDRTTDRFSIIFNDYQQLEEILQGTAQSNGVDYQLYEKNPGSEDVFGFVRYILPNSDAADKNIKRGDIFYAVNGISITKSNYSGLLGSNSYTLNMADYSGGNIVPNGESVMLTKSNYSENPIYYSDTYTYDDKKIGYLMYNGFYSAYDNQLNQVFGQFQSQGITHLIVDLRYNSGGSVTSATRLASMITGQYNGQVFAKQEWNQKVTDYFNENNPESLLNRFTNSIGNNNTINNRNLQHLYVITSRSSASASELLINSLKAYIDITVIGRTTTGKNVGSITLYDSPDYGTEGRNAKHRYAMQPIVLKITDKNGNGEYASGIAPDVDLPENLADAGIIGDVEEPLLAATIAQILSNGRFMPQQPERVFIDFKNTKEMRPFGSEMYLDKLPEKLQNIFPLN